MKNLNNVATSTKMTKTNKLKQNFKKFQFQNKHKLKYKSSFKISLNTV